MDEKISNSQVMYLGDSTGRPYRMKIRANSFGHLLSRRLGKSYAADAIAGSNSSSLIQMLLTDEDRIEHTKNAEIFILSIGGNNIIIPFLMSMIRALELGPLGVRTLGAVGDALHNDKLAPAKIIKELGSKQTKEECQAAVDTFKREFPQIINRIRELNPNVILIVQNVFNPFNSTQNIIYRQVGKPMGKYIDMVNDFIDETNKTLDFITIDLEKAFKSFRGKEDLTNIKDKDMHLTDFGHKFVYGLLYDKLVERYPELACEETPDIFKTRATLTKEELEEQDDADKRTAAILAGTVDKDAVAQPDDFSIGGDYDQYMDWFTEVQGMKFYPVMGAELTPAAELPAVERSESVVLKLAEDGTSVEVFNTSGKLIGSFSEPPVGEDRIAVTFALERKFPVIGKIFDTETPSVLYAVYPTYDFYKELVLGKKKEATV